MPALTKRCWWVLAGYFAAYLLAALYGYVGVKGMFGLSANGLSAVWLIFLGMPWNAALALAPADQLPEIVARAFVVVAPLFNMWLLSFACRKRRRRRG